MKGRNFFAFLKGIIFIQLFLVAVIVGLSVDVNLQYAEGIKLLNAKRILLPFSKLQINERQSEILFQENNVLFADIILTPDKILGDKYYANTIPESIIGSHIQALAFVDRSNEELVFDLEDDDIDIPAVNEEDTKQVVPLDSATLARFKKSQVFLYCTHNAESYIPDSGQARLDGKRGLVNQVAATMESALNEKGLPAHFVNTIHDYPEYNTSYTKSRATVSKIVAANKNILALFDIHRDSIPGQTKASTVKINGKDCAQILIIVGTNERKPHPNWQKNRKFAEDLYQRSQKMYPGLIKGVMNKAGTYNQEYHPHALLLELGCDTNTLEEVNRSARLFADVVIDVLKEAN
jgi:stage II sporulation protein P